MQDRNSDGANNGVCILTCFEVQSIAGYIECLKDIRSECLYGRNDSGIRLYYRGEPNDYGDTAGQPGINRGNWLDGDNESDLFRECERRLPQEFVECKTTFEKLVKMQHYRVPTRLLDISLDPLLALFFALYIDPKSKSSDNRDAVVLVYGIPQKAILNWHSDKVSVISNVATYGYDDLDIASLSRNKEDFNASESIHHLLHEIRAEKPHFLPEIEIDHLESIYCVHPLLDNPRIRMQQGVFLLFGINGNKHHLATFESNKGPEIQIMKILIPRCAKVQIREELNILGKTIDNVYPDWDGVSDYFGRFYGKTVVNYYKV